MIVAMTLALVAGTAPARAQDGFRVTYQAHPSQSGKVRLSGEVVNQRVAEVLDVYVSAEALDQSGRVVATGIAYVDARIGPGEARRFEAVVPVVPAIASYRVTVSSYRSGLATQAP